MRTPPRRLVRSSLAVAIVVATAGARLAAHDFWLEPSAFQPAVGSMLSLALRVGQHFNGEAVPRQARMIEKFVISGPDGERAVDGREGLDPAGFVTVSTPGLYVVGYRSLPSSVELGAEQFEKYLAEEGLDAIIEQRKKTGRSQTPGLEIYSRCAKTLVRTPSSGPVTGGDRPLGLRLELVAETNPYAAAPKLRAPHAFHLLYEGKPLAGTLVVAINRAAPETKVSARTDRAGRVALALTPGVWLVKAVHMIPAPAGVAAEWESLWASLTFELPTSARKSDATGAPSPRASPATPALR